jgi:orotate phosphoribosyltransferase
MTVATLASKIHAVSHVTGEFVLCLGRTATEYFDKYRFESDPVLLDEIAGSMAGLVPEGTELLAGLEMGAIAVATALARHVGLPCAFVRKVAKPYGTCRLAEGVDVAGKRVVVVGDVGHRVVRWRARRASCVSWEPTSPMPYVSSIGRKAEPRH